MGFQAMMPSQRISPRVFMTCFGEGWVESSPVWHALERLWPGNDAGATSASQGGKRNYMFYVQPLWAGRRLEH